MKFELIIFTDKFSILTDLLHKSHNAPAPYPTMHHFVVALQNGALWDICLMRCGISEMVLLKLTQNFSRPWSKLQYNDSYMAQ